jgi:hypothetical protein
MKLLINRIAAPLSLSAIWQANLAQSSRLIHSNIRPQGRLKHNYFKNNEHYYKSLLNDYSYKRVLNNNYRISMTLIENEYNENRKRITTAFEAKQFIGTLTPSERQIIQEELLIDEKERQNIQIISSKLLSIVYFFY